MNFNYHKMDFRSAEEGRESGTNRSEEAKMYFGCRKDLEDPEYKSSHNQSKDGESNLILCNSDYEKISLKTPKKKRKILSGGKKNVTSI